MGKTADDGRLGAATRADLWLLSLGHCATDLCQGALPVLLPVLQSAFGLSYALVGGVVTVFNLSASFTQPLIGMATDHPLGAWLLPAGVGLSALGLFWLALAPGYGWVLAAAIVTGLGVAAWHPPAARAAYRAAAGRRSSGTAIFSVGGNLGFALGPLVMGTVLSFAGRRDGYLASLPSLAVAALFLLVLPHLARRLRVVEANAAAAAAASAAGRPGRNRWDLQATITLVSLARASLNYGLLTLMPFYLLRVLHTDSASVGVALFIYLGAGAAGTLCAGMIADRVGPRAVLVGSMLLALPLAAAVVWSGWPWVLAALGALGFCTIASNVVTLVLSQDYLPGLPGVAAGINTGSFIGFGGLAVWFMGVGVDRYGLLPVLHALALLPILAIGCALLLPRGETGRGGGGATRGGAAAQGEATA